MTAPDTILQAQGLTKEFLGFLAVKDVNLSVKRGSIHALIGPNGAGKTTVFNLLTKFLTPSSGTIRFDGVDVTREQPAAVARRGLVRSFQISATFPHLTVLENIRVALQRRAGLATQFWRSDKVLRQLDARARELIADFKLDIYTDTPAVDLSYGRKRALEIATTLALDPTMLLLDEPMAGMGHEDIDRVVELIRKAAVGRTILMVEHNLSVVSNLCDTITVLQRGEIIAEGDYATVSENPRVREAYMGMEEA
ncbi:ABC transporter ATP-binding protein [Alsobacter metallidurans]|uniref:ABC transporter ATP-binding protein n=1 Tax=Alsobacter metallidurans TaxID=340221 RepID=A0A917I565_9HYPH|nr:ABC transporter ATP-binding protein [Alsobacter metallidurans]GGH13388.1 ABC transporter ATP-binding protein [Alsobacter metallidurans]